MVSNAVSRLSIGILFSEVIIKLEKRSKNPGQITDLDIILAGF